MRDPPPILKPIPIDLVTLFPPFRRNMLSLPLRIILFFRRNGVLFWIFHSLSTRSVGRLPSTTPLRIGIVVYSHCSSNVKSVLLPMSVRIFRRLLSLLLAKEMSPLFLNVFTRALFVLTLPPLKGKILHLPLLVHRGARSPQLHFFLLTTLLVSFAHKLSPLSGSLSRITSPLPAKDTTSQES